MLACENGEARVRVAAHAMRTLVAVGIEYWSWAIIGTISSTASQRVIIIVVFVRRHFIAFAMVLPGNIRGARLHQRPAMAAGRLC